MNKSLSRSPVRHEMSRSNSMSSIHSFNSRNSIPLRVSENKIDNLDKLDRMILYGRNNENLKAN